MSRQSEERARRRANRSWWFVVALVGLLALGLVKAYEDSNPPTNNEPYTGLCNRPTPQGGC